LPVDWRRAEDYDYISKLSSHDWAWELLRRNARYQAWWERWCQLVAIHGEDLRWGTTALGKDYEVLETEYGLGEPEDPSLRAIDLSYRPSWAAAVGIRVIQSMKQDSWDLKHWPGYPHEITLRFNLLLPIEPQIEVATARLKHCLATVESTTGFKAKSPPVRVLYHKRLILYLRLLDARAAGAGWGDIGRVLFRGKTDFRRSAKHAHALAMKLTESGYRDLLLRPNARR
jgi:Proteobacterial transcriptional regulator-like domain/T6SS, Transcription factor, DNA binding domain